jgi:hypothetical protein
MDFVAQFKPNFISKTFCYFIYALIKVPQWFMVQEGPDTLCYRDRLTQRYTT